VAFRIALSLVASFAIGGVVFLFVAHDASKEPDVRPGDVAALLERGRYEEAESGARAILSSVQLARGPYSSEFGNSLDLLVRTLLLNGKGSADETLRVAQRSVQIRRAHSGVVSSSTVISLLNLGRVLADRGDLARAASQLQQALKTHAQLASADDLDAAEILDALGLVLTRARSHDAALDALTRSLAIKRRLLTDRKGLIPTLETVAAALQGKSDYRRAREELDRALSIQGEPATPHPSQVTVLNLLAMQLWYEGEPIQSRDVSLRALQVAEQTLRPEHPDIARTLQILAATIDDLGNVVEARTYRERALAIAQGSLGEAHYELASFLNDLGDVNRLLGAYTDAKDQFTRALRIAEAKLEPEHEWIPMIVHNLALVDASLGDFDSARRQHTRAIAMWERALGPNHAYLAVALTELASVLREQGAAADALPLFERALAIRERALGPRHRDSARTMADVAATLAQLGQYERAQAFAARALSTWEQIDTGEAPDLAIVLKLYADLQMRRGANREAGRYFERALAIRRKVFGPVHPQVAEVEAGLALVDASLDEWTAAVSLAQQAENTAREHLRLMLRFLPEREALNYAANRPRGLDLLLSFTGSTASSGVAFDALVRSRALVLDEMGVRRHFAAIPDGSLGPLRADLISEQKRFANLLVRGPKDQPFDRYLTLVEEARRKKEEAERLLMARSVSYRTELKQIQAGLKDVQSRIDRDTALVSFVRYRRTPLKTAPPVPGVESSPIGQPIDSYMAFVLRQGGEPTSIPLGPAERIEPLVARWRAQVAAVSTARNMAAVRTAEESTHEIGAELRAVLWDSILPHLGGARTVFLVPDGALSLIRFEALPGQGVEFLLEEPRVLHYLSAERDLLTASRPGTAKGLLVLGGVDFNSRKAAMSGATPSRPVGSGLEPVAPGCGNFEDLEFQQLSGALQEVSDIATLWTKGTATQFEAVRILKRGEADERTFKQDAPGYRVLHLATHGFFLSGSCQPGGEALRSVGGLVSKLPDSGSSQNRSQVAASGNPLLLSGLALAGANRRAAAAPDEEDGILTAEEVASLNLEGVEWAVLSACDTGLGEIKAGEGVMGLRRAFQIAGARTVIMSLWAVDDQATRSWMRALYDGRLNRQLNTADAVRDASLSMLRERRAAGKSTHPFYWAAFVAAGDWH
jgi:CHAT domain-containing protein/tetratricopeptide (TPR) repeat protein